MRKILSNSVWNIEAILPKVVWMLLFINSWSNSLFI